jgi:hypothetical protein
LRAYVTGTSERDDNVFVITEACCASDVRTRYVKVSSFFSDRANRKDREVIWTCLVIDLKVTLDH